MSKKKRSFRPLLRVRTILVGIALIGVGLGFEVDRRRRAFLREKAAFHRSMEQFCRESAETYRCPEFLDLNTAESATREAEKHARLRRFYEHSR